ncbi:MAG: hypothetical protein RJB66_2660 [Pseudomonadota bacterium]|jgi:hypothetical protein
MATLSPECPRTICPLDEKTSLLKGEAIQAVF